MKALLFLLAFAASLVAASCGGPASGSAADSLNRGLQAQNAGKIDEATTAYYDTLAKDPKNKFALYNLGLIAHRQNRLVAAESFYRLALEQDQSMESALFNLAIVRTNVGAPLEAIALYRKVTAMDPNYADAHFNLGLVLRGVGQNAEAEQELATAQRLDAKLVAPATSATPRQSTPSPSR